MEKRLYPKIPWINQFQAKDFELQLQQENNLTKYYNANDTYIHPHHSVDTLYSIPQLTSRMASESDLASKASLLISGRIIFAWVWELPSTPLGLVKMHARLKRYTAVFFFFWFFFLGGRCGVLGKIKQNNLEFQINPRLLSTNSSKKSDKCLLSIYINSSILLREAYAFLPQKL